jgi:hypothetical protein
LEIGRSLANFSAAHNQAEVICFNVLTTRFEAVVHAGLQADLVAMAASLNTRQHGILSMFDVGHLIHGILLS